MLMWQHTYNHITNVSGDNMYLRDRAAGTTRLLWKGGSDPGFTPTVA